MLFRSTASVAVGVPLTILASAGIIMNDEARNSIGPIVPLAVTAALGIAYLTPKILGLTAACFKNAIYHLGPEYQVVAQRT